MDQEYLSGSQRRALAERALAALGADRHNHVLVRVRCLRNHHVATVYGTGAGAVVLTRVGPHAHGSRDFVDLAHHGQRAGTELVDLLGGGAFTEDRLPAGCECGARTLSRTELCRAIATYRRVIQVP